MLGRYTTLRNKLYICRCKTKNDITMGMKDKAMFALYLAAKKRKTNNNRLSSNNYDDDGYDGFDDHDE